MKNVLEIQKLFQNGMSVLMKNCVMFVSKQNCSEFLLFHFERWFLNKNKKIWKDSSDKVMDKKIEENYEKWNVIYNFKKKKKLFYKLGKVVKKNPYKQTLTKHNKSPKT